MSKEWTIIICIATWNFFGGCKSSGSDNDPLSRQLDTSVAIKDTELAHDTAFVPPSAKADTMKYDVAALKEVEVFMNKYELQKALQKVEPMLAQNEKNAYALAYKSIIFTRMAREMKGKDREKKLTDAMELARKSFSENPKIAISNLAMTIAYGAQADDAGLKEKMELSKKIKRYADRCLKLSPMHPECNYIVGRWYFGLADLGKMQSMFAQGIVDDTDSKEPTFDVALQHFKKALKGDPNNLAYNYYVGLTLMKLEKKQDAQKYLEKARSSTPKNQQERDFQNEASSMK